MRDIEFRGKSDKDWVHGYLYKSEDSEEHGEYYEYVIQDINDVEIHYCITNTKTIGQYTGLKDKNDKKIFEGDVYIQGDKNIKYVVVWANTGLKGKQLGSSSYAGLEFFKKDIEIIGNIHDNKELLGEE